MALTTSLFSMLLALIVLMFNWKVNRNALLLSFLMILIASSQIRHFLILHSTDPFWLALLVNNLTPLWSMKGACLFFYVRTVRMDRFEFKKSDLLHTIPFWVILVGIIPCLFTPFSYKIKVANLFIQKMEDVKNVEFNQLIDFEWSLKIRFIIQICYAMACLWMLAKFINRKTMDNNRPIGQRRLIYKWLIGVSVFVLLDALYFTIGVSIFFNDFLLAKKLYINFPELNVMGITLTSIPLLVLVFPEILYGIPRRRDLQPIATSIFEEAPSGEAYHREPLPDPEVLINRESEEADLGKPDPFVTLGQRVIDFMEKEKPYLRQGFSIEELAVHLNVPRHH